MNATEQTFGSLQSKRKYLIGRVNELWLRGELIGQYTRPLMEGNYSISLNSGQCFKLKRVGSFVKTYHALIDRKTKQVFTTTENGINLSIGNCYWNRPDYGDISELTLNLGQEIIAEVQVTGRLNGNWVLIPQVDIPFADLLMAGLLYDRKLRASRSDG